MSWDNYEWTLTFPKFLLIGDSITERAFNPYPYQDYLDDGNTAEEGLLKPEFNLGCQLQRDYTRRMDVVNRGFSGYTSKTFVHMIEKLLQIDHDNSPAKVKLATLFLGTNDAATAPPDGVPLPEFIENMRFIVEQITKRRIKLILIGPAHHYADMWEACCPRDVAAGILRSNELNKKYSDAVKELAVEFKLPFVDLFDTFEAINKKAGSNEATRVYFQDGIHFNGSGYKILYDGIQKAIEENYPENTRDNTPCRLGDLRTFDPEKVDKIIVPK